MQTPNPADLRARARWLDCKALLAHDGRIVGILKAKANELRSQADIIEARNPSPSAGDNSLA